MNIGIVTTWHEGGAGYVSRAYKDVLEACGHKVQIYARGGRYYPVGDSLWDLPNVTWGIRYTPLDKISHFNGQYINMLHFEAWLHEHEINIIITNEDLSNLMAKRCKSLGYTIGTYIDYYKKETLKQFKVYDFLLCNTQRHFSVFSNFQNAFYVPWGTDTNLFRPQAREKSTVDENVAFFHSANFGGINCRKGTDLLLEAFQLVKGNVSLVIHSQAPLSKFGDAAAKIINRDSRINFLEKTVPAPGLYYRGDVFVYPSRLEGIGLCVPEALACGLPVITTDNAPMNEFVTNEVNGLLVSVKETRMREDSYYWPEKIADISDLAKKMQIYVEDRNLLALHKEQARKSAEENLDWLKNASELGDKLITIGQNTANPLRRPNIIERISWKSESTYVSLLSYARSFLRKLFR